MKRILIAALSLAASVAYANDRCKTIGDMAETTMRARQSGVALSRIMEMPTLTPLLREMTLDAYKVPRFEVEENRRKAAQNFRESWELACYASMSNGDSV